MGKLKAREVTSLLSMQNPYWKIFLEIKYLFVMQLSTFLRHILGQIKYLILDKVIFV